MGKVSFIFLFLMFCVEQTVYSQKAVQEQGYLFSYLGQYKVSEKWGYHLEAQFLIDDEMRFLVQNLFRVGVLYYPSKQAQVAVGYAHSATFSAKYEDYFEENRIWQHFQHMYKWAGQKNYFINRVRLEERFIDQLGLENAVVKVVKTNYDTRLRYLNRNLFRLVRFTDNQNEFYAVIQDEFFMNFKNNESNSHFFDQNRFIVGLGINYNNIIRFETGYMNQYLNPPKGNDVVYHLISFRISHNLNFYKD